MVIGLKDATKIQKRTDILKKNDHINK